MSNVNGKSEMTPTESEATGTVGNYPHESQGISGDIWGYLGHEPIMVV